jgi:hypothetical protein
MLDAPKVTPHKTDEYHCVEPSYKEVPQLPSRLIVAGPSGCGKTQLLQALILDFWRTKSGKSCFERIYVFSPSVHADPVWKPVKEFSRKELKVDEDEEQCFFDHYDAEALAHIIQQQKKIVAIAKKAHVKNIFQILIVIDDFADNPQFSRNERLLHECFTRGRHAFCSTVVSTQKFRAISPIIRVNATGICCFRFRSMAELEAVVEENSALLPGGKKGLLELYHRATQEPYSFLYIKATATKDIFWLRFERPL